MGPKPSTCKSSGTSYKWNSGAAYRKATSNVTISCGFISKTTGPYDPKTDAYRACAHCGQHINKHGKNNECPG